MMKSFSVLQTELDDAKSTLKTFDNDIRRLIGRDPSELPTRPPPKRNNFIQIEERGRPRNVNPQNDDKRFKNSRIRKIVQENEEPPIKKRNMGLSVFKRLSERPVHDNFPPKQQKGMNSKVIVTPKEIPSRQERMEAQSKDEIVVARNRRMFGSLLGTLQKFQQEETKLKNKEEKRAQLEKKIEEHEIKEKEEIKKERQELFLNRKKKQAEIKMIELKMIRMKEFTSWEEAQKRRMNFIQTKAKPHIHFLPRKLKEAHKGLLENSKVEIQSLIDKKREQVEEELILIEERGRRIFEPRKFHQENKEVENEDNEDENSNDDDDLHQGNETKNDEDSFPVNNIENRTDNNESEGTVEKLNGVKLENQENTDIDTHLEDSNMGSEEKQESNLVSATGQQDQNISSDVEKQYEMNMEDADSSTFE